MPTYQILTSNYFRLNESVLLAEGLRYPFHNEYERDEISLTPHFQQVANLL